MFASFPICYSFISYIFDVTDATKKILITTDVLNTTENGPINITISQPASGTSGEWQTLSTTQVSSSGIIELEAQPVSTGVLHLTFSNARSGGGDFKIKNIKYQRKDVLVSNKVEQICSVDPDFSNDYRIGFNGQEKDNEVKGTGNSLDFGARVYDSRLGRFLSLDPLAGKFPFQTPYSFAGNTPIQAIDVEGKWVFVVTGTAGGHALVAGYAAGIGLAVGSDGIAFLATQSIKAGPGLALGATVNFSYYPEMKSVSEIGGFGYSAEVAGGFGIFAGGSADKSGDNYGATLSAGIGVGASASANVSQTALHKISYETLRNFFNGFHSPEWPFGDYVSFEERQMMKTQFIKALNDQKASFQNTINTNNANINKNNIIINTYNKSDEKGKIKMKGKYEKAIEANKNLNKNNLDKKKDIENLDSVINKTS
jgi:RHS repeat-associated protein